MMSFPPAQVCANLPLSTSQDALACLDPRNLASADDGDTPRDVMLASACAAFALSLLLNTPALVIALRDCVKRTHHSHRVVASLSLSADVLLFLL